MTNFRCIHVDTLALITGAYQAYFKFMHTHTRVVQLRRQSGYHGDSYRLLYILLAESKRARGYDT